MDAKKKKLLLIGGGLLAFFGLAITGRKQIASGVKMVVDSANKLIFSAAIPKEAQPYVDEILRVAKETGVDPFVIVALGQHESRWGQALTPKGPGGTGDFIKRKVGKTYKSELPPDGGGWGRGLMQIDYHWHNKWISSNNWKDPYTNILYAAKLFKSNYDALAAKGLKGQALLEASFAAYNAGMDRVYKAIQAGNSPESATYGGNYLASILPLFTKYVSKYSTSGGSVQA